MTEKSATINEKKDSNECLKRVIESAFDFLETGIKQFETQPKYSIINFCSGIELILKARLLGEHWALVVSGEPILSDFKSGKAKTIMFSKLIPKIENITGEKISKDIADCFMNIATHRNKVTHFFHEAYTPEGSKDLRKTIVLEQHNAWEYLQELFKKWNELFNPYLPKINRLDLLMKDKKRQMYLKEKFDEVKDLIEEEKRLGAIYKDCSICKYPASKEYKLTEELFEYQCKVCSLTENIVKIKCLECEELIEVKRFDFETGSFTCYKCSAIIDIKQFADILDTDPVTPDNYFERYPVNCTYCMGRDSVVKHYDYYICTECLEIDNKINYCGWCSEGQLGETDLTDSYECGCEFCEGHLGWHEND